jgi:hypothetical protein
LTRSYSNSRTCCIKRWRILTLKSPKYDIVYFPSLLFCVLLQSSCGMKSTLQRGAVARMIWYLNE